MACSSGKHDAPPPSLSDAEYRSALQAADATQAARNKGIIIVGTPAGDPIELATVGSRRAQHLDAYADDLARLIPPADLAKRHETMLKATKELAASNRKVAEHATGTSQAVIDIFSENGHLLEAFWLACRALTPEFICGTLTSSQAHQ